MKPIIKSEKAQKWVNVVLCAMMIFFCLGFCSSNKSLYLTAITEALDIKRSAYSLATSCRFVTTSVINMFFGALVYKFGSKKLILAGFVCLIGSVLLNSVATNVVTFCVSEALSGIAFSWSGTAMVGAIVNRWCKENTGTIMGAVLSANGIGGAIAAQIVTPIIYQEGNPFGYRDAYRLIAILLTVTALVMLVLFRDKSREEINSQTAKVKKKYRGRAWVGITFKDARHTAYFYGAAVCIFLTGMSLHAKGAIASAHMLDNGMSPEFVALVASISSLSLTGTKFLSGFLFDKLGLRKTISICCVSAVIGMFLLAFMTNSPIGKVSGIAYAIFSALALPLETVMLPLYAGDLFGQKAYNKMMGLFISINTAGYAVGGPFINFGFEKFGSYTPMLIILGCIMIAVLIGMQFVITSAHHVRDIVMAKAEEEGLAEN
ncbi:MAG: MFS transporter [Clostridia bacterium]|nr:MFS transporter [Clostridia bacterium]